MHTDDDEKFFNLRKEGKTYISKLFTWNAKDEEGKRNVTIVYDNLDEQQLGEMNGALCLRINGRVRKTQVTALVTQDDKSIKRLTLQSFKNRTSKGEEWFDSSEKMEFTFRGDEFQRLLDFINRVGFIDLSNEDRFQIEDISTRAGPKMIIDAQDRDILRAVQKLTSKERERFLTNLQSELSSDDVNTLLGRKQALATFEDQFVAKNWNELAWQKFFEQQQWVFGYGLDYRIMKPFDREMTVGGSGTDNKEKPTVDFLQTFTDYTVLVEIKLPSTKIFNTRKRGRSGTWKFSDDFINAVSQVLEQKAEWLASSSSSDNYSKDGRKLAARTRNAKTILVIGSQRELSEGYGERDAEVRKDTFELFRMESKTIDIVTFDELLERARFITR